MPRSTPRNPIRSARTVSSVTSRMFGGRCAPAAANPAATATALTAVRAVTRPCRVPNLIPTSQISEEYLESPLHRSRSALRDDRIAGVHVWRRSDRPEQGASDVRALRRAEIDAVQHVEDFPTR